MQEHGFQGVTEAENIAVGQSSVSSVMDTWMSSAGHARNILNPDFTHFGCAVAYDDNNVPYWVQNFSSDGRQHNFPTCPGSSATAQALQLFIEVL